VCWGSSRQRREPVSWDRVSGTRQQGKILRSSAAAQCTLFSSPKVIILTNSTNEEKLEYTDLIEYTPD
jgi:hypothetical protein